MKRAFDMLFSFIGIALLMPLFGAVALMIKLTSPGPVFFRQERVGRGFVPFMIYKFRTMACNAGDSGPPITSGGDARVTGAGRLLRRTKLDELPQLINVLRGEMSLVGPRPEVKKYVEMFRSGYEKLLTVRPGITDPASIAYADEEARLGRADDWESEYTERILPEKIRLSAEYVDNNNVLTDIKLILRTVLGP